MSNVTSYTRTSTISASTNNNNNTTGNNNNAVVGSFPPDYKRPTTGIVPVYVFTCVCV